MAPPVHELIRPVRPVESTGAYATAPRSMPRVVLSCWLLSRTHWLAWTKERYTSRRTTKKRLPLDTLAARPRQAKMRRSSIEQITTLSGRGASFALWAEELANLILP